MYYAQLAYRNTMAYQEKVTLLAYNRICPFRLLSWVAMISTDKVGGVLYCNILGCQYCDTRYCGITSLNMSEIQNLLNTQ